MQKPDELLSCPFCGGSNISLGKKFVGCDDCGAQTGYQDNYSEEGARERAWNTRATSTYDSLVKEIEEMEAEYRLPNSTIDSGNLYYMLGKCKVALSNSKDGWRDISEAHEGAQLLYAKYFKWWKNAAWKTIDSAPKDGTIITGYHKSLGHFGRVRFNNGEWEDVNRYGEDMGTGFYPTHWQYSPEDALIEQNKEELPQPPKER
jgi:hypothetical protein